MQPEGKFDECYALDGPLQLTLGDWLTRPSIPSCE
jgi:hypothetical protein